MVVILPFIVAQNRIGALKGATHDMTSGKAPLTRNPASQLSNPDFVSTKILMSYCNKMDRNGIVCRCCVVDVILHPTNL